MGPLTLLFLTSLAIHYAGALNLNTRSRYEAATPETKEKLVDDTGFKIYNFVSSSRFILIYSLNFPGCLVSRWFGRASERFKFCFRRQ